MWKPLFGNRAPKLPFPFTLPNHWRWWWPLARAWKKKNHQKSEIWEICAGMAQNYHFSSLCRNPRGRGHLVSANQGELSLGLVALLTTTDKKGKFRNVQTWEITTSENLNRNTFAPATIPPALKRSLANIHTHVLACADENELEPGTHFTSKHSVKKLLENRAHNISYI